MSYVFLLDEGLLLLFCLNAIVVRSTCLASVESIASFVVNSVKLVFLAIDELVHISGKRVNLETVLE
jgi:hypothetical protein